MRNPAWRARAAWQRAAVWSVAHAVNDGYPTLYLAVLPALMQRWHFNIAQAGLLAGLLATTTQALQPLWGWWADQRGGPWFIVGGLLASSLGSPLGLAWAPSYGIFAVALMIGGLGNAAFHPHMAMLAGRTEAGRRGRKMSAWMVSGMIGHALAPLAAVAAWNWGHGQGMALLAVPGLLAAAALYRVTPSIAPTNAAALPLAAAWRRAWQAGRTFFAIVVLRSVGAASLLTLLPILWHARHGSATGAGWVLTVVYATGMVGNMVGGTLSDRLGPRKVLLGSLALAVVAALAWLASAALGWWFWLAVGLWGFAVNGTGAVTLVYGQSLFPGRAAMGSGLTLGIGNTIGAFGAWAIGSVAQAHGLAAALIVAAGCLTAGMVAATRLSPSLP